MEDRVKTEPKEVLKVLMTIRSIHTPYYVLQEPCLFLLLSLLQLFFISRFSPCSLCFSRINSSGSYLNRAFPHTVSSLGMLCVQSWHGGLFLILQALVLSTFSDRPSPAAIFLYLPNSITFSCFVESIALLTICSHIFGRLISCIQQIFIGYLLCAV